ncbi:MAG: hypothetical protein ACOCRU_02255 [bacterium]
MFKYLLIPAGKEEQWLKWLSGDFSVEEKRGKTYTMGKYKVNLVGKANDKYVDLINYRNLLVRKQFKKAAAFYRKTFKPFGEMKISTGVS